MTTPPKNQEQAAEQVFGEALDLPPEQRSVFLDSKCQGQSALRQVVEALLEGPTGCRDSCPSRPSRPAITLDGAASHGLPKGTRLGRYEIIEPLGSGGMGAVFRAADTDLRRDVAVKVLREDLAGDAERVSRFQREARALAVLNHPNICTIYEIGEQDGRVFIAMEFIEGMTLRQRMTGKPLDLETALSLSIEIADALDAAHRRGSSIATSSRRISLSPAAGTPRSWISAWPRWFMPRPAASERRQRRTAHQPRFPDGHGFVHVSRAGAGQGSGRAQRSVLIRGGAIRDVDGRAAVERRKHRPCVRRHAEPDPGNAGPAESRTSRRSRTDREQGSREGSRSALSARLGDAG